MRGKGDRPSSFEFKKRCVRFPDEMKDAEKRVLLRVERSKVHPFFNLLTTPEVAVDASVLLTSFLARVLACKLSIAESPACSFVQVVTWARRWSYVT